MVDGKGEFYRVVGLPQVYQVPPTGLREKKRQNLSTAAHSWHELPLTIQGNQPNARLVTDMPLEKRPLSTPRFVSDTLSEGETIVRMRPISGKPLERKTIAHSRDRRLQPLRDASAESSAG